MTKDMDIDLEIEADEVAYIYLGTDKHNNLKNLDLPDSHPIRAITGLQEVVDKVGRTEDGAEVNEIVGVRVNGTPLDIAEDRTVDVPVPTSYGYYLDLDGNNGVISLKDKSGVVLSTIDTNLERIVKSGRYDASTNELVLVLDDSSVIRINASKLVDVYTADGETIVESGHVFALSKGSKDALKNSADHIADRSNPHNVTKDQVGLSNVDNTSDMSKPISTLVQQALDRKAEDSAVVHKTGSEDVAGTKRFDDVRLRTPLTLEPTSYLTKRLQIINQDTGDTIGYYGLAGDGTSTRTYISVFRKVNGETVYSDLQAHLMADGTKYALAPTWNAGTADNSDKILTTKMANSLPTLVHTTGSETIAGNKIFSNGLFLKIPIEAGAGGAGKYTNIDVVDNSNLARTRIRTSIGNLETLVSISVKTFDGSDFAELSVHMAESGEKYATAPDTADVYPDNAIVTKKYLLDKIAALEARISALEGAR